MDSDIDKKYILVTGGLGYIGSNTVIKLIENGYQPIIIDNESTGLKSRLKDIKIITGLEVRYIHGDVKYINNNDEIIKLMTEINIYGIIHFASYKSVNESISNPLKYYDNNLITTIELLNFMKKLNIKNIIFSSSATVYGEPDKYPVNEFSNINEPKNPYGDTKQICERILKNTSEAYCLNIVCLRYFNPIGSHESGLLSDNPKDTPENLIPYILKTINGEFTHLKVFGDKYNTHDGTAIRDYIDIMDLADAHVKSLTIIENNNFEIINIGAGCGHSVLEIINYFKKFNIEVPYQYYDNRPGDIEKIYADISKADRLMNWVPKRNIYDSIKSILKK